MASAAQIEANRLNAALSTGPATSTGKARSSRNHLKFGLFSTPNCVRPEETAEYTKLSKALWKDLNPVGPVEQLLAVEIVRTAWRLQRCAAAEAEGGENLATQASVDRARASAHNSLRRLLNDLRQFQSDRWLRAEILRDGFDEAYYGIADAHRVIKGLTDDSRLGTQSLCQALSPGNVAPTNRTQSAPCGAGASAPPPGFRPAPFEVGQAFSPGNPAQTRQTAPARHMPLVAPVSATREQPAPTNRSRSVPPVVFATGEGQPHRIPRNAPCPCLSGLKYKRCCGAAAPPVLGRVPVHGSKEGHNTAGHHRWTGCRHRDVAATSSTGKK